MNEMRIRLSSCASSISTSSSWVMSCKSLALIANSLLGCLRKLIEAVRERYRKAGRTEKNQILDEFAELAGVSPKVRHSGVEE